VVSTKSSVTVDSEVTQFSTSTANISAFTDTPVVRGPSPQPSSQLSSQPLADPELEKVIKTNHDNTDSVIYKPHPADVEDVVAAVVEDSEFGSFVSVSTPLPEISSENKTGVEEAKSDKEAQEDNPPPPNITVVEVPPTQLKQSPTKIDNKDSSSTKGSPKLSKREYKKGKSKLGKKLQGGGKKRKPESRDKSMEDNQSEISYQPDTDLAKSKVSKKINSKL